MNRVTLSIACALMAHLLLLSCSGGYSFTGGDVGEAETIKIDYFPNYAELVKPQLSQTFSEELRDIFIQRTSLSQSSSSADMEISGSIIRYVITPVSAEASDVGSVSKNRLKIEVNVIFTNNLDPDKSYEKRFSAFEDFSANTNLSQVEDELHSQISVRLSENILNQAIGDW